MRSSGFGRQDSVVRRLFLFILPISPHPTPHTRSDLGVSFCRTQKLTAEAHTPLPHSPLPRNKP
ncbi:MAG: hypothetical protein DWQ51_15500 [Microcystis wesenbergii TW10]|uniref:Uncharacterized protein n=2 Tax=Microcystis TaxID=1125 RepID=A0A552AGJ8_MICAE|nr:MAG: hypothetical protein DWQ51_15500 [Microcystis wesenbergii TW10]TRT84601.1 MAG: hypothetical protein EWV63_14950 [Microcystis aeruginosa Ma_OC_H_19870700_S124]